MKTRLLIASVFTFAVALVLAFTLRTAASAEEESDPSNDADPVEESRGAMPDEEEESSAATEAGVSVTGSGASRSSDEIPDFEGEISVWEEEDGLPPPGRQEDTARPPEDLEDGDSLELFETLTENGEDVDPDELPAPDGSGEEGEGEIPEDGEEESVPGVEDDEEVEAALTFDLDSETEVAGIERSEDPDTITVDFPDEEIRTILRLVADMFELNLVIPEELTGRASITLRNVTWKQIFDVILSPVGFTHVVDDNIIKVVSLESLTLEPPVTVVVILDYAQAKDIRETVETLISTATGGRIQVDERSNALVLTERPNQLRRIEEIIADLDRPNLQVMIESKFVETRNRHIEDIGVNWASLEGYQVTAGPFDHQYERERSSARDRGSDRMSSSETGQTQSSSSSSGTGGSQTQTSTSTSAQASESSGSFDSSVSTAATTRLSTAVFSADQFDVVLSALRTTDDVKLVSNPTVVTLNNRPARIHIGEEFPVVLPRFNPQTGTYEAGEFDTIDIGIKLDVTPQVNNAGFINLEVEPDVSSLASTVTYFGAQYPVRATRNAKSFVTIKDGFTLAIGGLVQEDTLTSESRVPVLGSIPAIGRLFRSNSSDQDQRNLIIFLTARTLSPDGSTVEDTIDPRMIHRMGLQRDEIPGYRPDVEMWPEPIPAEERDGPEPTLLEPDHDIEIEPEAEPDFEPGEEVEPEADFEPEAGVETGADLAPELEGAEEIDAAAHDEEAVDEVDNGSLIETISGVEEEEVTGDADAGESNDVPAENGRTPDNGEAEAPDAGETVEEESEDEDSAEADESEAEESERAPRSRGWLTP